MSDRVVEIPARAGAVCEDIRALVGRVPGREALETGDLDVGPIRGGRVQGLIRDVPTCREPIDRIVAGVDAIINGRVAGYGYPRKVAA